MQALSVLQLQLDGDDTPFLHVINTAEQYATQIQELTPATQQQMKTFTTVLKAALPAAQQREPAVVRLTKTCPSVPFLVAVCRRVGRVTREPPCQRCWLLT